MHDFEKNVVASSLCCAAEILKSVKKCNQPILENEAPHLGKLNNICLSLLRGDAMCQQSFDSDDEGEDEDEDDGDYNDDESNSSETTPQHQGHAERWWQLGKRRRRGGGVIARPSRSCSGSVTSVGNRRWCATLFASQFEPHFQAILKRAHPSRSGAERFAIYGLLADIVESVESYASPCAPALFANPLGRTTIDGFPG